MSDADDEPGELEPDEEAGADESSFDDRLDAATAAVDAAGADDADAEAFTAAASAIDAVLEAAETEADLDAVESVLEELAAALEAADLPEPDTEDDPDPREAIEDEIETRRSAIDEQRGPYAADVIETIEAAKPTIADTQWTDAGEAAVVETVQGFVEAVRETLDTDLETPDGFDDAADALDPVAAAIESADLDPDGDADTIERLVAAAEALTGGLDDAEEWDDLSTREQLEAEGFYDVLGHRKDYPPEWSALKEHEKRGNVDMVLLALEKLGMDFMEQHCLGALRRMGDAGALEPMLERADRRDRPAIEVLGKIGDDRAVETIVEYVGTDSDPQLQKTTLKALGEIGSEEATQAVADVLVAENDAVRTHAARALGMIGDTRAVEPLADVLADDASQNVRASAAWALNQIGTRKALEAAGDYTDDRSYLVQAEAEKAADAIGSEAAEAA